MHKSATAGSFLAEYDLLDGLTGVEEEPGCVPHRPGGETQHHVHRPLLEAAEGTPGRA